MAELSLWLDDYDDIYSDFDSRNYLKRRISEDFLFELKNALKYKKDRLQDLILFVPANKRDLKSEPLIVESLKCFFSEQHRYFVDKSYKKQINGTILLFVGILVMIGNAYIGFKGVQSFLFTGIRVILEPAGWFLIWVSLENLFYHLKELKKERGNYQELNEINIHIRVA